MQDASPQNLATRAGNLLEDSTVGTERLQGGDLSLVLRLRLASGRSVVAKSALHAGREASMLTALRAAGAPAPEPLAHEPGLLVLEDLGPEAPPTEAGWGDVGRVLRELHRPCDRPYGWPDDYAFGDVAIRNRASGDWGAFWLDQRLLADAQLLPRDLSARLRSGAPRIRGLLPDNPPPSLLHGDLWNGNIHFGAGGRASLIDPACYYGHAEVDLAMLTLFGSVPEAFQTAYGPLDLGWEERRAVYQLWPALVHLRLFGSGYRGLVERLLQALGC